MKKAAILLLCFAAFGFASVYLAFRDNAVPTPDAAAINDMIMTVEQGDADKASLIHERLTQIYEDMDAGRNRRDTWLQISLYGLIAVCAVLFAGLLLYCERHILAPFRRLKWFALKIAAGDLEVPLEMDREGIFGAFTESFDLMRVELIRARDDERIAREKQESLIRQLGESNAKIERYNKELQQEVERQTESVRNLQSAIVYSMSDLIEKKDGYTGGHTRRVSGYVAILLRELAQRGFPLSEQDIERAAESSLLHDMGKIAIPDSILLKNGKLSDDEFAVMKNHSSAGADSLQKSMQFAKDNEFLNNAFLMAKFHHEKWNGSGYPSGKKGLEIPVLARVTAIADVYDALRSERPYKVPFDRDKAKNIITEESGRQFDPDLVEVFLTVEPKFNAYCEAHSG